MAEIRLKRIAIYNDSMGGQIYGLGEDGVLYAYGSVTDTWQRMSMRLNDEL